MNKMKLLGLLLALVIVPAITLAEESAPATATAEVSVKVYNPLYDLNSDCKVDDQDLQIIKDNIGCAEGGMCERADLNGDGIVNLLDLQLVGINMPTDGSSAYDVNHDCRVDMGDLEDTRDNLHCDNDGEACDDTNVNDDDDVNVFDLVLIRNHMATGTATTTSLIAETNDTENKESEVPTIKTKAAVNNPDNDIKDYSRYDLNDDCRVDIVDLEIARDSLSCESGEACDDADVNDDGTVNIFDLVLIRNHMTGTDHESIYDLSRNCEVDMPDLEIARDNLNCEDTEEGCEDADVNTDGDVNIFDLVLIRNHLATSTATTTEEVQEDEDTLDQPNKPARRTGSSGSRRLPLLANNNNGEVLGASTNCGPYLGSYLGKGLNNDQVEVIKLQAFLNKHLGVNLLLSGFFDNNTEDAVKQFQLKNKGSVLSPWVPLGLPNENTATGYVYKTTLTAINNTVCPTLNLPIPSLL